MACLHGQEISEMNSSLRETNSIQFNHQRTNRIASVSIQQAAENYLLFPVSDTKIYKDMHTRAEFLPSVHCSQDVLAPRTQSTYGKCRILNCLCAAGGSCT